MPEITETQEHFLSVTTLCSSSLLAYTSSRLLSSLILANNNGKGAQELSSSCLGCARERKSTGRWPYLLLRITHQHREQVFIHRYSYTQGLMALQPGLHSPSSYLITSQSMPSWLGAVLLFSPQISRGKTKQKAFLKILQNCAAFMTDSDCISLLE